MSGTGDDRLAPRADPTVGRKNFGCPNGGSRVSSVEGNPSQCPIELSSGAHVGASKEPCDRVQILYELFW
jgi:hypothetical protein